MKIIKKTSPQNVLFHKRIFFKFYKHKNVSSIIAISANTEKSHQA